MRANLLQGGVFPSLKGVADAAGNTPPIPGAEFAKLMIWSFRAGFSEKLMLNLLARTEAQAGEQSQTVPHGRSGQARTGDQQPTEGDKPAAAEPQAQPDKRNGKK